MYWLFCFDLYQSFYDPIFTPLEYTPVLFFRVDEPMEEAEPSCCIKSVEEGGKKCCMKKKKNEKLIDTGLSKVLLGVVCSCSCHYLPIWE